LFAGAEPEERVRAAKIIQLTSSLARGTYTYAHSYLYSGDRTNGTQLMNGIVLGVGHNEIIWAPRIDNVQQHKVFEQTRLFGNRPFYEDTECVFHFTPQASDMVS
jgi:hypothetical protein